jgi:toxin ParE1/3/4
LAEVKLSAAADGDLVGIFRWTAERHGAAQAEAYLRTIGEAVDLLARFPMAGAQREDLPGAVRSMPVRRHRLFYEMDGETVLVLRVLHEAMSAERYIRARAERPLSQPSPLKGRGRAAAPSALAIRRPGPVPRRRMRERGAPSGRGWRGAGGRARIGRERARREGDYGR